MGVRETRRENATEIKREDEKKRRGAREKGRERGDTLSWIEGVTE